MAAEAHRPGPPGGAAASPGRSAVLPLVADLRAESAVLDGWVSGLDEAGWRTPTPAAGWSVADTISHLGASDEAALLSATDPGRFVEWLQEEVAPDIEGYIASHTDRGRALQGRHLLVWWRQGRDALADALEAADPGTRLPWFGPPMSLPSFVTARLMETWAHGTDVADALGHSLSVSDRLRHVADLGVRTRGWSYVVRGRQAPDVPVRVELAAPSGGLWIWGPEEATDVVSGPALDFCLLVTQRRHRDDLALHASGPAAVEWLTIAQAFAGLPSDGRPPRSAAS